MAETINPFTLIPDELPTDEGELGILVKAVEDTFFSDCTIARGTALPFNYFADGMNSLKTEVPDGNRGLEWSVALSRRGIVEEGTHEIMMPEPDRRLNPGDELLLLVSAKKYADSRTLDNRVAMNGPETTLRPGAPSHVHMIFPKGYDQLPRISGRVQAEITQAAMPETTRQHLLTVLLQPARNKPR